MTQKPLAIEITGLSKTYGNGTQALSGVDLNIREGAFFALLGANGAGKTTTIGILTSLVTKSDGKVTVFDHDLDSEINEVKRCIGVVPQEFNFSIFEKVKDIIVWQAGYFGMTRKEAETRADELLKALGLWDKREVASRELSGGMKRRLMIARALMHQPKLLILDEPTAGVDVKLRHEMWTYLKKLNKEGTTILLTTHYLEEVEQLCEEVALLKDGRVLKQDTVKNMLRGLDQQSYTVDAQSVPKDFTLKGYEWTKLDKDTLEVTLPSDEPITKLIQDLAAAKVMVNDIRPSANRMEQLYLNLLEQ